MTKELIISAISLLIIILAIITLSGCSNTPIRSNCTYYTKYTILNYNGRCK